MTDGRDAPAPMTRWRPGAPLLLSLTGAAGLIGALFLPWYGVPRPVALGPAEVNGWEAFQSVDVLLAAAAGAVLLSPFFLRGPAGALLRAAVGLGAGAVVLFRIVSLPVIPPAVGASDASDAFSPAESALSGPVVALVAAALIAAPALWGVWRWWRPGSAPRDEGGRRAGLFEPAPAPVMLAGIVLLAAALRFPSLDVQSFWYDETATLGVLQPGLGDMFDALSRTDSSPPLYYLLAWGWTKIFGAGEVGIRSLSAVLGTATVPLVYLAGRDLVHRRAGLAAAALIAVGPVFVWYSQETRTYALLAFTAALSFLALARAKREATPRSLALWAAAAALVVISHYYGVFLVAAEAAALLVLLPQSRRGVLAATGAVGAVGAALIPLAVKQSDLGGVSWIAGIPLGERVGDVVREVASMNTSPITASASAPPVALLVPAAFCLGVAVLLLVTRAEGEERRGALLAASVAAGAVLLPLLLAVAGLDYFLDRYLLAAWVPLAIPVATGLAVRAAPRAGLVALVVLCLTCLAADLKVITDHGLQRTDWRTAGRMLRAAPPEGRVLLVAPAFAQPAVTTYGHVTFELPAAGVRTPELVLIGQIPGGRKDLAPRIGAFRLAEGRQVQQVTVARYRARTPQLLTPAGLSAAEGSYRVLLEPGVP